MRRSRFDNKKEGVRMTLPANRRAVSGARRQLVRAFICVKTCGFRHDTINKKNSFLHENMGPRV